MALVSVTELQDFLQRPVGTRSGELAIRVAEGWLRSATALPSWPDPVPEELFGWALELAAIAYSNPESLETRTVDAVTDEWSATRRREILADAARWAARRSGAGRPLYSFPPPARWPAG